MIQHLLFVSIILLFYILFSTSVCQSKRNVDWFIYIIAFVLVLQSALRHVGVGPDTYAYYLNFEEVKYMSWRDVFDNFRVVYVLGEGKDAGYPLLVRCFQVLCKSYRIYLFFIAIFFFFSLSSVLRRYLYTYDDVLVSVFVYLMLFYSFFSITGIRQTLAVGSSMLAFLSLQDKKWIKYIFLTLVAILIHKSAAILLIFPILIQFKAKTIALGSIALFPVSVIYRSQLIATFREIAEYDVYETATPIKLMMLFFLLSIWIYYNLYKNNFSKNELDIVKLFAITFSWIPLLGWDSLFMREILYFSIYFVILIPVCVKKQSNRMRGIVRLCFVIFCIIMYLISSDEYRLFWQFMELPLNY